MMVYSAGVRLLDVVAQVDGQKEMVEEGVEITAVEGRHGIVIFTVGLALLHSLCDQRGIVVTAGKLHHFSSHEDIALADGLL